MYATHSKWIKEEVAGANYHGKPILAVNPWGQERKSSVVVNNASKFVGWNKQPIIDEIWAMYK